MKKIAALIGALALALGLTLVTQSPAAAAFNDVRQSSYSGNFGNLKAVCAGGAEWVLSPGGASSPCWNTEYVRPYDPFGAGVKVMCSHNGGPWIQYGTAGTFPLGAGTHNCRSYQ